MIRARLLRNENSSEFSYKIRREKRTTISEVIVRSKREILSEINKKGIGFISIFLLKAQVSYLTTEKLKLTFKG